MLIHGGQQPTPLTLPHSYTTKRAPKSIWLAFIQQNTMFDSVKSLFQVYKSAFD